MNHEFHCQTLPIETDMFEALRASVKFEDVGKGRQGTVLLQPDVVRGIPIVRTTTQYNAPAQYFQGIHQQLAQQIQASASLSVGFNNALVESYTNAYTKMGFHSDQALDLVEGSAIALFSCYQYPELATPPRKLVIREKESKNCSFEIPLTQNSVVVFFLETNRRFQHKIVLDRSRQPPENQWLGITFRTSKTFVQQRNSQMYFEDGVELNLANDDQRQEFYQLRSCENREKTFAYPRITYTVSESDLVLPIMGSI